MEPLVKALIATRCDRAQLINHQLASLVMIIEQITQKGICSDGVAETRDHDREDVQLWHKLDV